MKIRHLLAAVLLLVTSLSFAQQNSNKEGSTETGLKLNNTKKPPKKQEFPDGEMIDPSKTERTGIEVRIKDIARFRGVRSNQILGYGLVVGLEGTGDTKKTPFTATLLSNALKKFGTLVDGTALQSKNIAAVAITADLPPFATPGNRIDISVQSIGDATSLKGGSLLQAPLYGMSDETKAIAVAQGPISVGGFNVQAGGSSSAKNHVTVGRIPGGGIVEHAVPYQIVFPGSRMYLELDDADITTAQRLADKLAEKFPKFLPTAEDGGTIGFTVPDNVSPMLAMSMIEGTSVYADIPALVVVNERTGTIVVGGNVKIGPALIARGNFKVSIDRYPVISQPAPFSNGQTVVDETNEISTQDESASVAILPYASLSDLAILFEKLNVSSQDVIAILQALKEQGALKARIKLQ